MTHCIHGHALTLINRTRNGGCRECMNLAGRRWRASGKAWNTHPPDACPHCGSDLTVMGAVYRYPTSGRWECRICKRLRNQRWRAHARQERSAWNATASRSTAPSATKT